MLSTRNQWNFVVFFVFCTLQWNFAYTWGVSGVSVALGLHQSENTLKVSQSAPVIDMKFNIGTISATWEEKKNLILSVKILHLYHNYFFSLSPALSQAETLKRKTTHRQDIDYD